MKLNKKDEGGKLAGSDPNWEKKTRMEYDSLVKQKKLEVQNYQKQQLKDSVRIGYMDLAEIHEKYGFSNEAIVMMKRAYNECH